MPPFVSFFLPLLLLFLALVPPLSSAQRNISSFSSADSPWTPTQNQTLLSPNSIFAAGFKSASNSTDLFTFSVWYYDIPLTIVWSADGGSPVDSSASLVVTSKGQLFLNSSTGKNLWPPNATASPNSVNLTLRDDGNLIFGGWESFRVPGDTFLPSQTMNGTKLLSASRRFSFDSPNLIFNDTEIYWTANNGFVSLDRLGAITQQNGGSILAADYGDTVTRRVTLGNDGNLRMFSFQDGQWTMVWQALPELCKIHGLCGLNSICMSDGANSTYCVCPPGFRPASAGNYECQRNIPVKSHSSAKFLRLDYVNFTGGLNQTNVVATNYSDCESQCLANSACEGFMFNYDGTGYCVLQLGRLLYGYWSPGTDTANAMFLLVDSSETAMSNFTGLTTLLETTCPVNVTLPSPPDESNTTTRNIAIICTLFAAELISGLAFFWAFLKRYIKYRNMAQTLGLELLPTGGPKRFTLAEIKAATNGFSDPIGRGGFGDVYRGELSDKRVVAVKCLKNVAGGDGEFWAEVTIIARMHHLNLVRLWGFCAEKGQRILVYEYVPNGSLDKYLFRSGRSQQEEEDMGEVVGEPKPVLDWNIRYRIALGVARAIAYLHEECLEWVLHCDIKPENILLGDDFCPKISDFGLAKLRKKEDMVSMSRIRGTRGYMAPEWVKTDQITPKADVYSFGMVLLEIVSGVRNFEMQVSMIDSEDWYFPAWAFDKAFKEMKVEDILDRQIKHAYDDRVHFKLVDRMVKTAMWCLQDRPEMRPSMGKVAKMLEGTVEIMEPKKPTIFYLGDAVGEN